MVIYADNQLYQRVIFCGMQNSIEQTTIVTQILHNDNQCLLF